MKSMSEKQKRIFILVGEDHMIKSERERVVKEVKRELMAARLYQAVQWILIQNSRSFEVRLRVKLNHKLK